MKTALAIALVALSGSFARADEPAPTPNIPVASEAKVETPVPAPAVGTEAALKAKTAPQVPVVFSRTPGNFCGQACMLDWMLQTEVGQRLERERQAEMQKALEQQKLRQQTNVEVS